MCVPIEREKRVAVEYEKKVRITNKQRQDFSYVIRTIVGHNKGEGRTKKANEQESSYSTTKETLHTLSNPKMNENVGSTCMYIR